MKIIKKDIFEIVDSNSDLIGVNDIPMHGSDLESQAKGTTDNNAKIGTQPFRYDMLGRFGFTMMPFFEGKDSDNKNELIDNLIELIHEKFIGTLEYYYKHPNKLKSDYRYYSEHDDVEDVNDNTELAIKIVKLFEPYFENAFNSAKKIDESKIVEDMFVDRLNDNDITNNNVNNEVRDKKLEKIAGLINKLDKNDVNKIINLLEMK